MKSACHVALCILVLAAACGAARADQIVSVSIPVNSMDATCYPLNQGVWSTSAPPYPFNTGLGPGTLINPGSLGDFCLHDHVYSSGYVPDPSRAVITYEFDTAAVVSQIEIIQHSNGITNIECFVGDSLGSLTSIGSFFGPDGDVTGWRYFAEKQSYVFDLGNAQSGRFLQVVIRKTAWVDGWASYQIYPRDAAGARFTGVVPEPATAALLGVGCLMLLRRRRR